MYYNQSETSSEFSTAKLAICNLLKKLHNSDSFFNVSYNWYKSLIKLVLDKGLMSPARLFHFYKCIAKYHRNLEVNFWVNVRFADWNYSLELLTCVLLYDSLPERQCSENFCNSDEVSFMV